jgi:hypothetical protein
VGLQVGLPPVEMEFLSFQVVDDEGPIVEKRFRRPVLTMEDVETLVSEASAYMENVVRPWANKAWFLTCYDELDVASELLDRLQERIVEFNQEYSHGDVRYGGKAFAKVFVIATSIRSAAAGANHFASREDALEVLRKRVQDSVN